MNEPETSKQTVYGTWEEADEIPYYPNVFERIWNLLKNMFTRKNKKVGEVNDDPTND